MLAVQTKSTLSGSASGSGSAAGVSVAPASSGSPEAPESAESLESARSIVLGLRMKARECIAQREARAWMTAH